MTNSPDLPPPSESKNSPHFALMQSAVQFTAEIASLAVTANSLDDLLKQIVNLIVQRFGYYHASIFLIDETARPELSSAMVLRAAAGESSEEILKAGARIIVGSRSVVGWVAAHNQYRLASDVSQEFFYQRHDLLAKTRSEIAVPIAVRVVAASGALSPTEPTGRGRSDLKVLGVLDVQHTLENAFDPGTITVLQTTAHHLAAVIQNFKLFELTRRSLSQVSALYQASSLMARARTIQDIQAAIQHVLDESIYQHQQLVIVQGATGIEDELAPYAPAELKPGSAAAGATPQPARSNVPAGAAPKLYLSTAQKCLQQAVSALAPDVQRLRNVVGAAAEQPQLVQVPPYLLLDLTSSAPPLSESDTCSELAAYARAQGLLSAAFIPVTQIDRLEMLLLIGSGREKLQPDQFQAFISLADMATTAIERVYAIQTMQKRLTVMHTLNVISQAVSVQTNLQELYRVIHTEVKNLMGEISFLIALHEPENKELNSPAIITVPYLFEMGAKEATELPSFAMGEGLTSIVINTRQPLVLVEDTERRSAELGARFVGVSAKSWMGVPLLVAGDVIGAIVIQDPYQERRFDEDDLRLMVTLASQVAVAIRNARLLESTHRQAERERALNEITAQIRSSGSAQKILQTATEEVARLLGASRAHMVLITGEESQPPLTGLGETL